MTFRIAIVDDEQAGISVLSNLVKEFIADAKIVGTYRNAKDAILGIRKEKPDVLFTDIEMEDMTGLELVSNIADPSLKTIFVTAHQKYAIEAIRTKAFDYLLKPIRVKEFLNVFKRLSLPVHEQIIENDSIMINTSKKVLFVPKSEIVMIKGEGSYSRLYMESGREEIVSKNLAHYEREINSQQFFRTHQSFLVNVAHVKNLLLENGLQIEMNNGLMAHLTTSKKAIFLEAMLNK